jgi:hypothetical protein
LNATKACVLAHVAITNYRSWGTDEARDKIAARLCEIYSISDDRYTSGNLARLTGKVIPLTITACQRVAEAVPIAEPNADAATGSYVSQFSALHSAIPGHAGRDIEEYQ